MQTRRSVIQARPKGQGNQPFYAPARDLAYVYAPAMREAVAGLDQVHWTPEIKEIIAKTGISEDDLGRAVQTISRAHEYFVNCPDVNSAEAALSLAGFYDVPAAATYLVMSRLGVTMLGGFFVALRDVSEHGNESAQSREVAELVAAGVAAADSLFGRRARPEPDVRVELLVVRSQLTALRMAKDAAREANAQLVAKAAELAGRAAAVVAERDKASQVAGTAKRSLEAIENEGFWPALRRAFGKLRFPWQRKRP